MYKDFLNLICRLEPFHEMEILPGAGISYNKFKRDWGKQLTGQDALIAITSSNRPGIQANGAPLRFTSSEALNRRQSAATCELCDKPFTSMKQRHGDHNHTTGEWRGVLCMQCNMRIGWLETLEKHLDWLARALKYLDK
jgi:recombination endonuclease VII